MIILPFQGLVQLVSSARGSSPGYRTQNVQGEWHVEYVEPGTERKSFSYCTVLSVQILHAQCEYTLYFTQGKKIFVTITTNLELAKVIIECHCCNNIVVFIHEDNEYEDIAMQTCTLTQQYTDST